MSTQEQFERRYDLEEVEEIFGRASRSVSIAPTDQLTLDELKHIGEEAGIDPAAVEKAARELGASRPRRVTGRFPHAEQSCSLALPPDSEERLADALVEVLGDGDLTTLGHAVVWTSRGGPKEAKLEVRARSTGSEVRLSASVRPRRGELGAVGSAVGLGAVGAMLGAITGAGFSLHAPAELLTTAAVTAGFAAGSYQLGRLYRAWVSRSLGRKLEKIAKRLAQD